MIEQWKDVVGWEGLYQVSNIGRIRSMDKKYVCGNGAVLHRKEAVMVVVFEKNRRGRVNLTNNGKKKHYWIHRLIATAFIPNPGNKPEVNHIDGNPSNNSASNLEWCTRSENIKHSYNIGIRKSLAGRSWKQTPGLCKTTRSLNKQLKTA